MARQLVCPQGHPWELDAAAEADRSGTHVVCPVCGAPAVVQNPQTEVFLPQRPGAHESALPAAPRNNALGTGIAALRTSQVEHADRVCDQFEAAWKAGQRPRIEDYLQLATESERAALLRDLLPLELDYRHQAGERPDPHDYQQRFPTLDPNWLAQALALPADVAAPTQPVPVSKDAGHPHPEPAPGAQRLRCPHCHNPIQLKDRCPDEVLCPACGGSFQVRDARPTTTVGTMRPLGKFQLLERVGLGAFGAVWKARDTQLDRIVALKIPHAGALADEAELARFQREARAAAQLRHPNIVTVYEVLTLEGLPTIVSDFIEGVPLKDLLEVRRLTLREAATLVAELAAAMHYAHEMGVVHRDLKPSNIMIERHRLAEGLGVNLEDVGKPLVMDFGLALRGPAETTLTLEGHIIGTPAYMSPEQAAGKGHQADRRSDVYSLGVILYELLTGELPFRGSRLMLLSQVLHEEPRPPRRLNDQIPRDLETICLKALAKSPERRYATARALAEDLHRWLNGEPIQARPISAWERGWTWAKRKPAAAGLLVVSAMAVLALVGAGVAVIYNTKLQKSFEEADEARQTAAAALAEARFHEYFHHIARAHAGWWNGALGGVEQRLDACPTDQRHWEWHYLKQQCHTDLLTLQGHTTKVWSVAFSPDGTRLASASEDGTVKVWDATTGQEIRTLKAQPEGECLSLAYSADGVRLASAGYDETRKGQVKVWDLTTGQETLTLDAHPFRVWYVAFSPDSTRLASVSNDKTVKVWDLTTGKNMLVLQGHTSGVMSVAFSADGKRLASGSWDKTVRVWDTTTENKALFKLTGHSGLVVAVAFSPDGTRLASASFDGTVKIWDATAEKEALFTLKGHASGVGSVAFSPDGKWLASASVDQTVKVWQATTGQEVVTLKGHINQVRSVAFSPDGIRLASASWDQTVKVWNVRTAPDARTLTGHTEAVHSVAYSPDGKRLASASGDRTVKIWDATTGQMIHTLPRHTEEVTDSPLGTLRMRGLDSVQSVAFSPDGTRLASGNGDGTVMVWDGQRGQKLLTLRGHAQIVASVAFSPNGQRLASASGDRTVKVWDARNGDVISILEGHTREVTSVTFSPDGQRLASASGDRTVKIWDMATGQEALTLRGHTRAVHGVAFSPDGTRLASASWDQTVTVWDGTTGQMIHTLRGHTDQVWSVVFSPNGKRLASASWDGTIKIWEATTGQEALTLPGHKDAVRSVAFSPDGGQLASASWDGTVKLWDARPLTPEGAVEREAMGLLDGLFARPLCRADVLAHLNSSLTLRAEAREKARALVGRYREETDPESYHQASWAVVRQPYLNAVMYRLALHQAETACRLAPQRGPYLTTLGVAQYRAGQYPQALTTLTQADLLHRAASVGLAFLAPQLPQALATFQRAQPLRQAVPANLAFLAMTQHQLGQQEQAQTALARLREIARKPEWATDEETQRFLREAENMMRVLPAGSRE